MGCVPDLPPPPPPPFFPFFFEPPDADISPSPPAYSLQRFKLNIANSVVNQQNAGLESMATDNVLDLFKISTGEEDAADAARKKAEAAERGGPVSQKSLLDGLEDLPAEDEYGGLGMDSFLSGLGGQS